MLTKRLWLLITVLTVIISCKQLLNISLTKTIKYLAGRSSNSSTTNASRTSTRWCNGNPLVQVRLFPRRSKVLLSICMKNVKKQYWWLIRTMTISYFLQMIRIWMIPQDSIYIPKKILQTDKRQYSTVSKLQELRMCHLKNLSNKLPRMKQYRLSRLTIRTKSQLDLQSHWMAFPKRKNN